MPKEIYTLTRGTPDNPGDEDIFDLSRTLEIAPDGTILKCGSYFTSYYIRRPDQQAGWEFDDRINPGWQLDFHHKPQPNKTVIGGFGSGKTMGVAVSYLTWATVLTDFKFLNVAPTGWQSKQMYDTLLTWLEGTLFAERFLWKAVEKPFPKITIKYRTADRKEGKLLIPGRVVTSTMEFMSMSDDARRILTWEGDAINIDQGEQHESLTDAIVSLGTRLRGIAPGGRERMGQLSILANSEDNPELWYIFDLAETRPTRYWSKQVTTYGNGNLSVKQVDNFKDRIKDPDKLGQYLGGDRPTGGGIEFSAEMVAEATDPSLDADMQIGLKAKQELFELREEDEAGVVLWKIPPRPNHDYVVVGDPGHGRPPYRNAPVVLCLDITDYPTEPAKLSGFWWGNAGGRIDPFLNQFLGWRKEFRTLNCAFDATAGQHVYSQLSFRGMDDIIPIDLAGSGVKKKSYINTLKLKMLSGKLKWPKEIPGLRWQFLKYKLPDEKIAQDIVSAFIVFAGYLWWLGIEGPSNKEDDPDRFQPQPANLRDRHSRPTWNRGYAPTRVRR